MRITKRDQIAIIDLVGKRIAELGFRQETLKIEIDRICHGPPFVVNRREAEPLRARILAMEEEKQTLWALRERLTGDKP